MLRAQIPQDETQRLAAVNRLGLLNTAAEDRFDRVTQLACKTFNVPLAMISLIAADRQWSKSAHGAAPRDIPRDISFCAHTILRRDPLVLQDTRAHWAFADNPLVDGEPRIRFYAGCPLRFEGYTVGSLCIVDHESREFDSEQIKALRTMADIIENEFNIDALSLTQSRLIEQLDDTRRRELLDALTGIWNRRGIEELLPRELSRAARNGDEVAVMMIDVDHFQKISARHGPALGDQLIQEVSRRLRGCVRPHDVLGRYADDDFLVFLGRCDRSNAQMIGTRMISSVTGKPLFTDQMEMSLTLSIGIYSMQDVTGRSMGQIIEAADQALHVARDSGRNRVAHY